MLRRLAQLVIIAASAYLSFRDLNITSSSTFGDISLRPVAITGCSALANSTTARWCYMAMSPVHVTKLAFRHLQTQAAWADATNAERTFSERVGSLKPLAKSLASWFDEGFRPEELMADRIGSDFTLSIKAEIRAWVILSAMATIGMVAIAPFCLCLPTVAALIWVLALSALPAALGLAGKPVAQELQLATSCAWVVFTMLLMPSKKPEMSDPVQTIFLERSPVRPAASPVCPSSALRNYNPSGDLEMESEILALQEERLKGQLQTVTARRRFLDQKRSSARSSTPPPMFSQVRHGGS